MIIISIIILAVLGFGISLYTYVVENKIKKDSNYKPACDLSDRISCSKPMLSPYGNIFFFSNAVAGMLYYILIGLLAYVQAVNLLLIATVGGFLFSLILAYLLYFKIKAICLLCTSLYIVNIALLILSIKLWNLSV